MGCVVISKVVHLGEVLFNFNRLGDDQRILDLVCLAEREVDWEEVGLSCKELGIQAKIYTRTSPSVSDGSVSRQTQRFTTTAELVVYLPVNVTLGSVIAPHTTNADQIKKRESGRGAASSGHSVLFTPMGLSESTCSQIE